MSDTLAEAIKASAATEQETKLLNRATMLLRLLAKMPHQHQMDNIEFEAGASAVRFTWRGTRFRVGENTFVEEVNGQLLGRTDLAILVEAVLKS